MADISENNPMKEFSYALVGIALFLGIVLLIGISAFLRPAGEHIEPEPVVVVTEEGADEAAVVADSPVSVDQDDELTDVTESVTTEAETKANTELPAEPLSDAEPESDTAIDPADATVGQSATATAEGTVSQAAVSDATIDAEMMDADADSVITQ